MKEEKVQTTTEDEMSTDEWLAERKEAGPNIDPNTAETFWCWRNVLDPYNVLDLPPECIGREYFARSPGSDIWVSFQDIPDVAVEKLWERMENRARPNHGPHPTAQTAINTQSQKEKRAMQQETEPPQMGADVDYGKAITPLFEILNDRFDMHEDYALRVLGVDGSDLSRWSDLGKAPHWFELALERLIELQGAPSEPQPVPSLNLNYADSEVVYRALHELHDRSWHSGDIRRRVAIHLGRMAELDEKKRSERSGRSEVDDEIPF